ncbi:MAG: hypothetical protein ABIS35_00635 [Terracoccus sp.]
MTSSPTPLGGPDERPTGFLTPPGSSPDVEALYAADVEDDGFVMNLTHLWAHLPDASGTLFDLLARAASAGGLTRRQRGLLVTATASTRGDAYCSLAWGARLADETTPELSAAILDRRDSELPALLAPSEVALVRWARQVVADPGATTAQDVQALRDAGLADGEVFAVTLFVALRLAFSTVNGALGARPDQQLATEAAGPVLDAVRYGRPPAGSPSRMAP